MDRTCLLLLAAAFLTTNLGRCQVGDELPLPEEKDNQFPPDFPPSNDTIDSIDVGIVENTTDELDAATLQPFLEKQDNQLFAPKSDEGFSNVVKTLCPDVCMCSPENESDNYTLTVDCSGKELFELPESIDTRTTVLNLQNNKLTALPKSISDLKKLRVLNASNNNLKDLTYGTVSELPELRELNLANNELLQVPQELKNDFGFTNLEKLNLGGNDIRDILQTETFSHFTSIQELTLPEVSDVYVEQLCRSLSNLHKICKDTCEKDTIDCSDVMEKLPVDGLMPVLPGELPTLNATDPAPSDNNQRTDYDFADAEVPPATDNTTDNTTYISSLESSVDRQTPTNISEVFGASIMNVSIETTTEHKQDMIIIPDVPIRADNKMKNITSISDLENSVDKETTANNTAEVFGAMITNIPIETTIEQTQKTIISPEVTLATDITTENITSVSELEGSVDRATLANISEVSRATIMNTPVETNNEEIQDTIITPEAPLVNNNIINNITDVNIPENSVDRETTNNITEMPSVINDRTNNITTENSFKSADNSEISPENFLSVPPIINNTMDNNTPANLLQNSVDTDSPSNPSEMPLLDNNIIMNNSTTFGSFENGVDKETSLNISKISSDTDYTTENISTINLLEGTGDEKTPSYTPELPHLTDNIMSNLVVGNSSENEVNEETLTYTPDTQLFSDDPMYNLTAINPSQSVIDNATSETYHTPEEPRLNENTTNTFSNVNLFKAVIDTPIITSDVPLPPDNAINNLTTITPLNSGVDERTPTNITEMPPVADGNVMNTGIAGSSLENSVDRDTRTNIPEVPPATNNSINNHATENPQQSAIDNDTQKTIPEVPPAVNNTINSQTTENALRSAVDRDTQTNTAEVPPAADNAIISQTTENALRSAVDRDTQTNTAEVPPAAENAINSHVTENVLRSGIVRGAQAHAPEASEAAVLNTHLGMTNEQKQDMKAGDVNSTASANPDGGGVDKSVVGVIIAVMIVVVAALVIKKNWNSIRDKFSSSPRPASERPQAHTNGTTPEEVPLQEKSPV